MGLLQNEDPERYARLRKNMRRDNPNAGMTEEQALTNFMLGLPTGTFRFAVIAGRGAPVSPQRERAHRLLHNRTDEEWVLAIMALANAPEPTNPSPTTETASTAALKPITKKGGRPKLSCSQKASSLLRRKEKVRANVSRFRDVLCNQKTPSRPLITRRIQPRFLRPCRVRLRGCNSRREHRPRVINVTFHLPTSGKLSRPQWPTKVESGPALWRKKQSRFVGTVSAISKCSK
jgi:hypothetical protein